MSKLKIAVIPGDGIGWEVIPEGLKVLEAVGRKYNIDYSFTEFDWGCERYHKTGKLMPDDGIETLKNFDSIFLGACGYPGVPDHISLWGLLIPIRREMKQYVNLRPVRMAKWCVIDKNVFGSNAFVFQVLLQNLVCRTWINVIRPQKRKLLYTEFFEVIVNGRNGLLIGRGAGVKDVLRGFFSLVLDRVKHQPI